MVIKSSKEYHVMVIVLFCCVAAFFFLLLYSTDGGIVPAVVPVFAAIFLAVIVFRFWIAVGRTLIMDEKGCTVKFLGICRSFKWSDLKTKRIEDYTTSLGYRQPYVAGAVFSLRRTRKPSWLMPTEYSFLVHPFSFFFVYFDPHIQYKKWDYQCPNIYVVDEVEFRKNMEDWNVELL